jgi:hypothetical protein
MLLPAGSEISSELETAQSSGSVGAALVLRAVPTKNGRVKSGFTAPSPPGASVTCKARLSLAAVDEKADSSDTIKCTVEVSRQKGVRVLFRLARR